LTCLGDSFYMIGDFFTEQPAGKRGLFSRIQSSNSRGIFGFRDCLDGTSNTIAMGEACFSTGRREIIGHIARITGGTPIFTGIAVGNAPAACNSNMVRDVNRPKFIAPGVAFNQDLRGNSFGHGYAAWGGINTILPPNSPSCAGNGSGAHSDVRTVVSSVASYHQGGAHVLMTDGAVRFVTENIEAGNAAAPTVCDKNGNAGIESPYGLWGALGTRNGAENRTL
jgi:prepilin-type processing-associated H-X9-DG protein